MYLKTKIITALAAGAMLVGVGIAPATAAPPAAAERAPIAQAGHVDAAGDVTGTLADGSTFEGALSGLSTSVVDRAVQLTGSITGTITSPTGVVTEIEDTFTATLDGGSAVACDILNLDLGPLDLNLLGLQIDLAPVVLDITGVPGPGNLLGNLLCAVSGLLDKGVGANAVSNLLDRIFSALDIGL